MVNRGLLVEKHDSDYIVSFSVFTINQVFRASVCTANIVPRQSDKLRKVEAVQRLVAWRVLARFRHACGDSSNIL